MTREYDALITQHYREVAEAEGLSPTSTMSDERIRTLETKAILGFVGNYRDTLPSGRKIRIADIGCGNGYTLKCLADGVRGIHLTGIEKSEELRKLTLARFAESDGDVEILAGDVRDPGVGEGRQFDLVICQRVLINLLDLSDQRTALANIVGTVKPGGGLLFLESFEAPLARLNAARAEFDLPAIEPAHHNLYLPEDFFLRDDLELFEGQGSTIPANFLSTHYFVTRVLHPLVLGDRPFKKNSEFVSFFSDALAPATGDYAPLRLCTFRKKEQAAE